MSFFSRFNPAPAVKDFWTEFSRPNQFRWPILAVSVLVPGIMLFALAQQRVYAPPAKPKVTYISTFAEGRTDEEIIASNIENQRRQDALAAEQAAREEEVQDMYRALGRATGMDVDAIDRRIAEQRAQEQSAEEAKAPAPDRSNTRDTPIGQTAE